MSLLLLIANVLFVILSALFAWGGIKKVFARESHNVSLDMLIPAVSLLINSVSVLVLPLLIAWYTMKSTSAWIILFLTGILLFILTGCLLWRLVSRMSKGEISLDDWLVPAVTGEVSAVFLIAATVNLIVRFIVV